MTPGVLRAGVQGAGIACWAVWGCLVSGCGEWVGACLFVERLGCQVDAVGPCDGSGFGIDCYLGEVRLVVERFQDAGPPLRREVDVACGAVGEKQPQRVASDHGDACDDRQVLLAHGDHATAAMA